MFCHDCTIFAVEHNFHATWTTFVSSGITTTYKIQTNSEFYCYRLFYNIILHKQNVNEMSYKNTGNIFLLQSIPYISSKLGELGTQMVYS